MPDLELVPTEELIAELERRFDHAVFCGLRVQEGGCDVLKTWRSWTGNAHACIGLAVDIQGAILEDLRESSEHA